MYWSSMRDSVCSAYLRIKEMHDQDDENEERLQKPCCLAWMNERAAGLSNDGEQS